MNAITYLRMGATEVRAFSYWGVLWRSVNELDGDTAHLVHDQEHHPRHVPVMFATRAEARAYIDDRFGYLRDRPDLRAEPFGWRMPVAIRVTVRPLTVTGDVA